MFLIKIKKGTLMRFNTNIFLSANESCRISKQYRKKFISLIKQALNSENSDSDIFQKYYGNKKQNMAKPFTFSVQIPIQGMEEKEFILGGNCMRFYFSSSDPAFLITVYNGLAGLKDFSPFAGYKIHVRNFYLQKDKNFNSDEMVFKTLSPVIVRDINQKKGQGFIGFDNENFQEQLFYSMKNMCLNFISKDYELQKEQVEIMPVKCKTDIINHYGGEIGTSGIFKIKAPKEVLKLIYDAGLGVKRSQGFGMLEVVG